jgi:glucose-6-phosphate isomerase
MHHSGDYSVAWQTLADLAPHYQHGFDLREVFVKQPRRFEALSLRAPHLFADLSKNLWDSQVLSDLLGLAQASGLVQRRQDLLQGRIVNTTEQRPAVHATLRCAFTDGAAITGDMGRHCQDLQAMLDLAEQIRQNTGIRDVVHIGIGGSGLGPELAVQALRPCQSSKQRIHFVSNMDGHDLHQALDGLKPEHTLFIVASKSWSTAETLRNAQSALEWFTRLGGGNPAAHFVAITGKADLARAMGMGRVLHLPEGIGGRFSLWSAVGLPLAIAIGSAGFQAMLKGASAMDAHFEHAPLQANLPVWLGLLDVWNSSFLHLPSRCVAPYHHGLRRLPAYLQQLEMESNGKQVGFDGTSVNYPTAAAVWGEPGSNGQHAFFQWLHQGTQRVPVEIIVAKEVAHPMAGHQLPLIANALAQAQALMMGADAHSGQLKGHQDFPGNRPSSFVVLDDLSPGAFGALLALQEHRVFVSGTVWGINSFDQWGVELGKTLATDLQRRLHTGAVQGLDSSTAGLLAELRAGPTSQRQQAITQ